MSLTEQASDLLKKQASNNADQPAIVDDAYAKKSWTVMVYLSGDSNLNVEMAYALDQIKSVTKDNANISLYVYFDGFSEDVPTMYCDFSGNKAEFYQSRHIKHKVIPRGASLNENSAAVSNVINFIDWCVEKDKNCLVEEEKKRVDRRKDKDYAIIFSGHSFGFMDWGLFKDQKANYSMTLSKLAWMFCRVTDSKKTLVEKARQDQQRLRQTWNAKKLKERTKEILGKPFTLLGFDSCVLSTLEISSQFHGLAETIVSSEGTIPAAGWNYAQILLGKISDSAVTSPQLIAASFVDEFIKQQSDFAVADMSVDMAAWNVSALPKLQDAFGNWARILRSCFQDDRSLEYHQLRRLLTYVHWQCQTYMFEQHVDLGDICQLLSYELNLLQKELVAQFPKKLTNLIVASETVLREIRSVIILSGFSGRDYQFSNGISIFFPWSLESYRCAEKDYKKLLINRNRPAGAKGSRAGRIWVSFLEHYLSRVTLRPAKPFTAVDSDGTAIIVRGKTKSVVYRSYDVMQEDGDVQGQHGANAKDGKVEPYSSRVEPYSSRVEPYSARVEPYTARVEPYSARAASAMGILLQHFSATKNVRTSWNRTGFISTHLEFEPVRGVPSNTGANTIQIPRAAEIQKVRDEVFSVLREKRVDEQTLAALAELIKSSINRANIEDAPAIEMLGNLSYSLRQKHSMPFSLQDVLKEAIKGIRNRDDREKLLSEAGNIL